MWQAAVLKLRARWLFRGDLCRYVREKRRLNEDEACRQAPNHQQPAVNYLPRFETGDFPGILNSQGFVFRENRPSRERRNSSLLVAGGTLSMISDTGNPDAPGNIYDVRGQQMLSPRPWHVTSGPPEEDHPHTKNNLEPQTPGSWTMIMYDTHVGGLGLALRG